MRSIAHIIVLGIVAVWSSAMADDLDADTNDDERDNCVALENTHQRDLDGDGIGDACDSDRDGDGVENIFDNCPLNANARQLDIDRDGRGDLCQSLETAAFAISNEGL